ncbi:MAG: hypothetical protein ACK4NZ_07295 [Tsuneonella sp.]
MTVKNPYEPPTYGVRNLAIERRIAGKPPASVKAEKVEEPADETAEKPAKAPAKKGKK